MPLSAIERFSTNLGHGGTFSGPVVTGSLPNRRNEALERISKQASRLRQGIGQNGVISLPPIGRNDSLEQLLVRLGIIPIATYPNPTSLTGTIQAWGGRRPVTSENLTVTGPTAATSFVAGDPAKSVAFAAGGANQSLQATDSVDAAAVGRGRITIAP